MIVTRIMMIKTSATIGASELKLEIMTDRPTDRPNNRQTDTRAHREVLLPL